MLAVNKKCFTSTPCFLILDEFAEGNVSNDFRAFVFFKVFFYTAFKHNCSQAREFFNCIYFFFKFRTLCFSPTTVFLSSKAEFHVDSSLRGVALRVISISRVSISFRPLKAKSYSALTHYKQSLTLN
jgi:hypothetical protein